MLRSFNLPNLDRIGDALLTDLDASGLLKTTLVVMMGEMGREPKTNRDAGRDHWPKCGFSLLFGAGARAGFVHGASDRLGAYPTSEPVAPADIVATIYSMLGINPESTLTDLSGRPFTIAHGGRPIRAVMA